MPGQIESNNKLSFFQFRPLGVKRDIFCYDVGFKIPDAFILLVVRAGTLTIPVFEVIAVCGWLKVCGLFDQRAFFDCFDDICAMSLAKFEGDGVKRRPPGIERDIVLNCFCLKIPYLGKSSILIPVLETKSVRNRLGNIGFRNQSSRFYAGFNNVVPFA